MDVLHFPRAWEKNHSSRPSCQKCPELSKNTFEIRIIHICVLHLIELKIVNVGRDLNIEQGTILPEAVPSLFIFSEACPCHTIWWFEKKCNNISIFQVHVATLLPCYLGIKWMNEFSIKRPYRQQRIPEYQVWWF